MSFTDNITGTAIVFTNGLLHTDSAKTAHGLIRGSARFRIAGIVDAAHAGKEAGTLLDGKHRNMPVFANIQQALAQAGQKIDYGIVGIAPVGGRLPAPIVEDLKYCLENGISVVSGLHEYVSELPGMADLARQSGARIVDVRLPKHKSQLHFWSGDIFKVHCPIVAVMGLDTAIGKRTTARMLTEACRKAGMKAEMIYTGQTGWMQGNTYGFVLDSVYNDFVSGELEHAIYSCYKEVQPDIIFLEGQSSLRNPSGPCGAEFLLSGQAKQVVLVYDPKQKYFDNDKSWGKVPTIRQEIALVRQYGSKVIGIALNTRQCSREEALKIREEVALKTGLPVVMPVEEGVDKLIHVLM